MPIAADDAKLVDGFLAGARAALTRAEWDAEHDADRALSQEQAAMLLLTLRE